MNIPIHVYVLFFVLLFMGINRCYSRTIKIQRLFIAPVIFTLLSVRGMYTLFELHYSSYVIWIFGVLIGVYVGFIHVQAQLLKVNHQQQLVELPRDLSMLYLILAIFGFEFFIHYSIEAKWTISTTKIFSWVSLLMLGVISGMSIGRTLNYFLKYKKSNNMSQII